MLPRACVSPCPRKRGGVNIHATVWYIMLYYVDLVTFHNPFLTPPFWLKVFNLDSVPAYAFVLKCALPAAAAVGFVGPSGYLVSYLSLC